MFQLMIPGKELWDEKKEVFVHTKDTALCLESPVRPGRRRAVGSRGDRRSRVSRRSRAHGVGGDVGYPPDPS